MDSGVIVIVFVIGRSRMSVYFYSSTVNWIYAPINSLWIMSYKANNIEN